MFPSTVVKPANIRIHGSMYRKVHAASDSCPLRYLVVDPLERLQRAEELKLDKKTVQSLTDMLEYRNPHMSDIKRNMASHKGTLVADVRLEWHEGVNEVAAIIDDDPTSKCTHRRIWPRGLALVMQSAWIR